jgi:uncharacterized protein
MTPAQRRAILALVLLVPAASIGTWLGMYQPFGPAGKPVFVLCKIWLLAFPVLWLMIVDRQKPAIPPPRRDGMPAAILTGLGIVAIIAAAFLLVGKHWIDIETMRQRASEFGLDRPAIYIAGALYWCLVNSLLEEYVWRWFVFTRLRTIFAGGSGALAVVLAALLFTLHHIIALDAYFDWRVTVLASLGVFIGGVTWSWLYLRYRNIWAPYVSHVLADAVIFVIGYWLLFQQT